ncbi:unnamed protein product [Peronospora farinosa]|uniref:RING-type domain-containing protein n=1 Tax=Peronospora farinosa TaxID=134698 RepID=A0ABN8CJ02_9STRA|nr:unnamed protein product [Peronospora farinosa]
MGVSFECSDIRNGENSENTEDIVNPCAICLEEMEENLTALVCGHVFHHTCVTQSLVRRPACPVCRRQASSQVRLYLSIGAREKKSPSSETPFHNKRGGNFKAELNTNCNGPTQTVSRLSERMREMKVELDHVKEIQRMTSSHSFRLENKLVRLRQQQDQTKQQMQHIEQELDRANAKLRRSQRIATISYARCKETKQANAEFERKVYTTANRMLEKIREHQRICCPSCVCQWTEMKHIALELITTAGVRSCCQRHSCHVAMSDVGDRLTQHHCHAQRYDV